MKKTVGIFLRIYAFLVFSFLIQKVLFMSFYHSIYTPLGASKWAEVLYHGLSMDLSVGGMIMVVPALLLVLSVWWPSICFNVLKKYLIVSSFLLALIYVGDLALYGYWGFRLDNTALFYLQTPREAFASVEYPTLLLGLVALLVESFAFYLGFYYFVIRYFPENRKLIRPYKKASKWWHGGVLLVLGGSLFLPIRGGVNTSTMNVGRVFFSDIMELNHAALNPCFSFLDSLHRNEDFAKEYRFMTAGEASTEFSKMVDVPLQPSDTIPQLFTTKRPNVVVIVLESFMSAVIEPLGGEPGVTPCLNQLCKEGVAFENLYANSFRTDRGLVSILSGYPGQPNMSIMKHLKKAESLPSLPRSLGQAGYTRRYYYGGDADFTNMRGYLVGQGVADIISEANFPTSYRTTDWGVPDAKLFERASNDLKKGAVSQGNAPFFHVIQTSSSHEPFKVDVKRFKDPYRNSVYYVDSCINNYFVALKKSPYWKNTVVLLVADHPYGSFVGQLKDPILRRRIPALLVGGAIKKPLRISTLASQIDLVATVLAQCGLSHKEFRFSKNIMNPRSPHFAIFTYPDCLGMVAPEDTFLQDNVSGRVLIDRGSQKGKNKKPAQAFLQTLFDDIAAR